MKRALSYVIVAVVMFLAGGLVFSRAQVHTATFSDVPPNHWAYGAVTHVTSKNIMVGFPDGTFRMNRTVTRGDLAVTVDRLMSYIENHRSSRP